VDKRPLRAGLVVLSVAVALAAMLLTGCGGGGADDGARVEASLEHYLSTPYPQQGLGQTSFELPAFPVGAGPPRVRENSCKKTHTSRIRPARTGPTLPARPEGLTLWSCVVMFGKTAFPAAVAVKRSGEVYLATLVSQAPPPKPATVYEGGP